MLRSLALVFLASLAACATVAKPKKGTALVEASPLFSELANTAAFDHGCPEERVLFMRMSVNTFDLDVCGAVRRYKMFGSFGSGFTYLDVTSLYPASSLPPPLSK